MRRACLSTTCRERGRLARRNKKEGNEGADEPYQAKYTPQVLGEVPESSFSTLKERQKEEKKKRKTRGHRAAKERRGAQEEEEEGLRCTYTRAPTSLVFAS